MSIFAAVPLELLEDARLTPRQFRFMVALLSFCQRGKNICFPSRALLAKRARLPIPRVSEVSAQLVELGWLAKEGNGGRGKATRYTILTPETSPDAGEVTEPQTVTEPVTVTDLVTVTETVTVSGGGDGDATDEETVTEPVTVTETVTVSEPEEQNGYRFKQKTVTDLVTPIEETRNRQVLPTEVVPPLPPTKQEAKPAKRKRNTIPEVDMPEGLGIDAEEWAELLMICRKKDKPLTRIRWNRMVKNAAEAGMKPHEVVSLCAGKGWASYEVEYNATPQNNGVQFRGNMTPAQMAQAKRSEMARQLFEPYMKAQNDAQTVDAVKTTVRESQLQLLEQKHG